MATLMQLRRRGTERWQVLWNDATKGEGKLGRRWADCLSGDHRRAMDAADFSPDERAALADGAKTRILREKLRRAYEALEQSGKREAARAGGTGRGSRYGTPLVSLLDDFMRDLGEQVALRAAGSGRSGKSARTRDTYAESLGKLRAHLKARKLATIATGDLDVSHLKTFRDWLARTPGETTGRPPTAATTNRHLRAVKTFLRHYMDDDDARPYFRMSDRAVMRALKREAESAPLPERFEPDALRALLQAAREMDAREAVTVVRRKGSKGKREQYEQPIRTSPVFPWVVLLMFTGCRVHEATGLKWSDVDLDRGAITFRSRKTGRDRRVLLADEAAPISPGLLALLRAWRQREPDAVFVLPQTSRAADPRPAFPKFPWGALNRRAGQAIRAKALRSNWVSWMAAIGRSATQTALQAGHSPLVLERHYLSYRFGTVNAPDLDTAMGVADLLADAI